SDEVMSWEYGSHASTFGGNPVSCAAALATIELIENGLLENAQIVGNYFKELLTPLAHKYTEVAEVRGKGLMIGIEFIKDKRTKERYPEFRNKLVLELYNKGVLTLGCGYNNLRLAPALILTQEQAAFAAGIIDETIHKLIQQSI
ncbi:MAG: aminotransferase class III-fold pyridoxal phosphate-dependent enzyme, partial [Candidatus Sumerlaeia bacterium]|nr:aminotransferase class III-fold pyridoxal phosphate-dependent enzyme [Candidatus Sumerlaeia bacterium]